MNSTTPHTLLFIHTSPYYIHPIHYFHIFYLPFSHIRTTNPQPLSQIYLVSSFQFYLFNYTLFTNTHTYLSFLSFFGILKIAIFFNFSIFTNFIHNAIYTLSISQPTIEFPLLPYAFFKQSLFHYHHTYCIFNPFYIFYLHFFLLFTKVTNSTLSLFFHSSSLCRTLLIYNQLSTSTFQHTSSSNISKHSHTSLTYFTHPLFFIFTKIANSQIFHFSHIQIT